MPSFSQKYEEIKTSCYSNLRYVCFKYLEFNASERAIVNEVMENLIEDSDVAITSLAVFQATALEFNDRKIVEANIDPEILRVTSIPDNDGTNAWVFLSLGIVNQLTKYKSEDYKSLAESVIIDFPKKVNIYQDKNMLADLYKAYSILSRNDLLDFSFEFFEHLVDNYPIYSIQFQKKVIEALSILKNKGRLRRKNACSIFHASIYIFAICADYDQNIRVLNSRPTPTELDENGTGVVVSTKNLHFIYEWIIKRLRCSKRSKRVTPFLIFVDAEKR